MRKIALAVLVAVLAAACPVYAANSGKAGRGFEYRSATIKRSAGKVTIAGVLINKSGQTYITTNFTVQTFDRDKRQNGLGIVTIPNFPTGQPRNFNITIELFKNTHVQSFNIRFTGGDTK